MRGLIFGIIDVDDEAREDMKYYYEKENANHQNYIGHDPDDLDQDDQDEDTKPILIHPEVDMVEGYDRCIPTIFCKRWFYFLFISLFYTFCTGKSSSPSGMMMRTFPCFHSPRV